MVGKRGRGNSSGVLPAKCFFSQVNGEIETKVQMSSLSTESKIYYIHPEDLTSASASDLQRSILQLRCKTDVKPKIHCWGVKYVWKKFFFFYLSCLKVWGHTGWAFICWRYAARTNHQPSVIFTVERKQVCFRDAFRNYLLSRKTNLELYPTCQYWEAKTPLCPARVLRSCEAAAALSADPAVTCGGGSRRDTGQCSPCWGSRVTSGCALFPSVILLNGRKGSTLTALLVNCAHEHTNKANIWRNWH